MLRQVLHEIENAREPVTLAELGHSLGIERSALEGMLAYWVGKGRLQDDDGNPGASAKGCTGGACGASCAGPGNCAFIAKMPKTYSLSRPGKKQ